MAAVQDWRVFLADFTLENADHNRNVALQDRINALGPAMTAAATNVVDVLSADAQAADHHSQVEYQTARTTLLAVLLAAIVLGILLGLAFSASMVRPLRKAVKVLQDVAAGDLTAHMEVDRTDEFGAMATALNTSISSLHDVVRQIDQDADTLAATLGNENQEAAGMADNLHNMISMFITDTNGAVPARS